MQLRPQGEDMRRRWKKLVIIMVLVAICAVAGVCVVTYGLRGPVEAELEVYEGQGPGTGVGGGAVETLTLLNLNAAHGRGTSFSQFFVCAEEIKANLDAVAELMGEHQPHVVALQEIDGPSGWSGNFNHVHYLADKAGFAQAVSGENVAGLTLSYGTAVLSRLPIEQAKSFTFAPSPPTPSKGYVLATIDLPGRVMKLDVVSVHLDFLRSGSRRSQALEMIEVLRDRGNPIIIMGDLNCEWADKEGPVRMLVEDLGLEAYRPEAGDLATFPMGERRLDWVLVSPALEFQRYEVLTKVVSDHQAVLAVVGLPPTPSRK